MKIIFRYCWIIILYSFLGKALDAYNFDQAQKLVVKMLSKLNEGKI